jgi:hypothetical protein
VASLFYTTPTDDGAITVTCDHCWESVSSPDPWAAANQIVQHRCDQDTAMAHIQDRGPAVDRDQPAALHLLAGRWVASCPTCGFQLATAGSQARAERRGRHRVCPVCHEVAQ